MGQSWEGTWVGWECRDGEGCCWRFTRWQGKSSSFMWGTWWLTWVGDVEVLGTDGVVWEMRRTRRGWGGVGFGEKGRRKRVQRVWRGTGLVWCVVWAWRVVGVGVGEIGHIRVCVWRSHGELTNSSRKELGQVWCWSLDTGGSARRGKTKWQLCHE